MANILLLLGGQWHDFAGFAAAIQPVLERDGHNLEITYDLDVLSHLDQTTHDLVLLYTCLAANPEGELANRITRYSDSQINGLARWVRAGGALLAAHAATAIGASGPAFEDLLGGAFIDHPPLRKFKVIPLAASHPITRGIAAFEVFDELYHQRYHATVTIHMITLDKQEAYPMVWSKPEGLGRVAHIALGHSHETWALEPFQRLMLQTIQWLLMQ